MRTYKPTLLIDFDGVIAEYDGKFDPNVVGKPKPNAIQALRLLMQTYKVVIFTTRPPDLINAWQRENGCPPLPVSNYKEPAFLQIDDRAIEFRGEWSDDFLKKIREFQPYWKQSEKSEAAS